MPNDAIQDTATDTPSFVQDAGSDAPAGCNPQTCPLGCCAGDACVTAITPDQCGSSGEACVKCQANENCKGVCFHPQANCGPANCHGCCLGDNDCAAGNAAAACGNGGQQCTSCVPSKGTGQCIPEEAGVGGTCTDQQCGPDTCPSGCCQNGVCVSGLTEPACGQNGVACQTCGSGTFCIGGECKPGTACTPQNCPNGCCGVGTDGGICFAGTDDTICGTGGASCTDCQNANQVCVAGVCGIPCSPSTCHGCCDGNICAEGDQSFLCGTGGAACNNCEPQGQTCMAGACK
ncbi:MAG: hypothetical protein ACRELB_12990 [Polyangiaceae bacterium]